MQKLEIKLNNLNISTDYLYRPTYFNAWEMETSTLYSTENYEIPITSDLSFLKDKSRIGFSEYSSFPKFKLQVSNYVNARNLDKIDLYVISQGQQLLPNREFQAYVYQYNECYYLVTDGDLRFRLRNGPNNRCESTDPNEILNWLISNNLISNNATYVYHGMMYMYSQSYLESRTALINMGVPITTDKELDIYISNQLELINKDNIGEIKTLLDSPDFSVKGTGLKMLASSNYYANKYQIKYLLATSGGLNKCPEWNSVSCVYMRKALGVSLYDYFNEDSLSDLTYLFNKAIGTPSKEDDEFIRAKLFAAIEKSLAYTLDSTESLLKNVILENPIKINLTIE